MVKFSSPPHPYGVVPTGNAFFADKSRLAVRGAGLGPFFGRLSDEVIIEFLTFLSSDLLVSVLQTSRSFYTYCHHPDLWRDMTLREFSSYTIRFWHTWKDTYMQHRALSLNKAQFDGEENVSALHTKQTSLQPHSPLRIDGAFSNLLYKPWACRTSDLRTACPGFFAHNDIPKVVAATLSVEDFVRNFESKNIPVIIQNAVTEWPALQRWNPSFLSTACNRSRLRTTSATASVPALLTAREYFEYCKEIHEDEVPLYLFERDFLSKIAGIEKDYAVPSYFSPGSNFVSLGHNESDDACNDDNERPFRFATDLFSVLGEGARPDYKWLIAGPARSGSIYHIDPNQTNAWNVSIQGRKKWIFYPPDVSPPGVVSSVDGADVAVPISTGEWLLTFWQFHLEARRHQDPSKRPLEAILYPSELIFVPHGYWHMVVNLDDCIALTHNYVSTSNLADCLRFLREKPDQISGVRDRKDEAVQPENLYETFVKKLEVVLPRDAITQYIADSFEPSSLECLSAASKKRQRSAPMHRAQQRHARARKHKGAEASRLERGDQDQLDEGRCNSVASAALSQDPMLFGGEGRQSVAESVEKKETFSFGFNFS